MPKSYSLKSGLAALAVLALAACGGGATDTPDKSLLIGEWVQAPMDNTGQPVAVTESRVSYKKGGQSDFYGVLVLSDPALPDEARHYDMKADVTWTLTESILVRTLNDVTLTPRTSTPQSEELADLYEDGLRQTGPATYLVEELSETRLVINNPEDGTRLSYTR